MAAVQTEKKSVRAQAKYVHVSARKARLVTDLIRGRSVPEARTILAFSKRAVARGRREGPALGRRERRVAPRPALERRRPRRRDRVRRRGPDAEALPPARARPRVGHPQADVPHHGRARAEPARRRAAEARRRGEAAQAARAEGSETRRPRQTAVVTDSRAQPSRSRPRAGPCRGEAEGCSPEEEDRGE